MKTIQEAAIIPLSRLGAGDWSDLSFDAQANVARWAAMFTMSYEFADRDTVAIPADERHRFRLYKELEEDWIVAAGVSSGLYQDSVSHRAMFISDDDKGTSQLFQISAWDFGYLILATVYAPSLLHKEIRENLFKANLRPIYPFVSDKLRKPPPNHYFEAREIVSLIAPSVVDT